MEPTCDFEKPTIARLALRLTFTAIVYYYIGTLVLFVFGRAYVGLAWGRSCGSIAGQSIGRILLLGFIRGSR